MNNLKVLYYYPIPAKTEDRTEMQGLDLIIKHIAARPDELILVHRFLSMLEMLADPSTKNDYLSRLANSLKTSHPELAKLFSKLPPPIQDKGNTDQTVVLSDAEQSLFKKASQYDNKKIREAKVNHIAAPIISEKQPSEPTPPQTPSGRTMRAQHNWAETFALPQS